MEEGCEELATLRPPQHFGERVLLLNCASDFSVFAREKVRCLEKQILNMVDSPFIIKLYATYSDQKYLYFLIEPLLGREFHPRNRAPSTRLRFTESSWRA